LQRAWAAERGLRFDEDGWLFEITTAQVIDFKPDVLLVADYSTVTAAYLRRLKEVCPSIRLVLGWCGAPYDDGSVFRECDVVLSCVPELVTHFREAGHRSRHVNHAFAPRVLEKLGPPSGPTTDFVFVGSVFKSDRFHVGREKLLARLVEETGLQIWSGVASQSVRAEAARASRLSSPRALAGAARRAARRMLGGGAPTQTQTGVDARVVERARPALFGLDMFRQLRAGRVALNTHIDISTHSASNMRLFEATGVGACLLTDSKENLRELFEPDAEAVAYHDADECVEKVKYLLGRESVRRSIAAAGQCRTLRDHTFASRAALVDAIIREELSVD
jgi:hypothetical protein